MFKIYDGRKEFYQWDLNQKLIVNDDTITEMHFCNGMDACALVCEVYTENGTRLVNVPNIILQSDFRLKVWGYAEDHTKHETFFKVNGRSKPADYIYTETEIKNYEKYEERLMALEDTIKKGDGVSSIVIGAEGSKAVGNYSVAGGYSHTANGKEYDSTAIGRASMAFGKGNTTYGKQSVAFGCYSTTGDKNGTAWDAEGEPFAGTDTPSEDLGKNSIAAGYNNSAWGESTVAMGSSNTSMGKSSVTLGNSNKAYGYGNVALGFNNNIGEEAPKANDRNKQYYGHGSGGDNTKSNAVVAIGRENHITDTHSVGIGANNKVYSENALALGTSNNITTYGNNSIAIGHNNVSDSYSAVAIGSNQIVGKDKQIVIGNGGVEETKADIILNGINTNLLSLSEADGAYTFDTTYHEFTYPIFDCRYHNYNATARGAVFVADMNRENEVPHLIKGQKIIITINGVDYSSTINEVWGVHSQGNFSQNDIFGNAQPSIRGAAFRIHEATAKGAIYQALNALGDIDTLRNSIVLKIEDASLNLASLRAEEKVKTINAITLGKNPIVDSGTLFAIGNAVNSNEASKHNAFEIKNNGDIVVSNGVILTSPNGARYRLTVNNDGTLATVRI